MSGQFILCAICMWRPDSDEPQKMHRGSSPSKCSCERVLIKKRRECGDYTLPMRSLTASRNLTDLPFRAAAASQFPVKEIRAQPVRCHPVAMQQEVVNLIRKDMLLHRNPTRPQS